MKRVIAKFGGCRISCPESSFAWLLSGQTQPFAHRLDIDLGEIPVSEQRQKTLKKIAGIVAVLVIFITQLAQPANAQNKSFKVLLDPAKTEIHWKLTGGLHTTHGTFKLKSGEFLFNSATGLAEGEILVDATTGESGNATRDKRMQNEVLESNRYPAIFFHPTQMKGPFKPGEGTQNLIGEGTFNIHGADHPIELPLKVQIATGAVTATTQFTVPYVAWGMKDPSKFLLKVGKQVEIQVTAKGTLQQAE
jgi:YceI-like domain